MKVPNTNTFDLVAVIDSVRSHYMPDTAANLLACFLNSYAAFFDPTYNQNGYAPENSMLRFRNYTPRPIVVTIDPTSITKQGFNANADFLTRGDVYLSGEVGVEIRYADDSNGCNMYGSMYIGQQSFSFQYQSNYAENLINAKPLTAYKYRAMAIFYDPPNMPTYYYGEWKQLTTLTGTPNVGTWAYAGSGYIDAFASNVYVGGAPALTQVGICYSRTNSTPTINDSVEYLLNQEGGPQWKRLMGLLPNTTYYIRAFASNSLGLSYGEIIPVTVLP